MARNNFPVELPEIKVVRNDTLKVNYINLQWANAALITQQFVDVPFNQVFGDVEMHIRSARDGALLERFTVPDGSIRVNAGQLLLSLGKNNINLEPGTYRGDIEFHRLGTQEAYTLYTVKLVVDNDYTYDVNEAVAPVPDDYAFADIIDCRDRPLIVNFTGIVDVDDPTVAITPANGAVGVAVRPLIDFVFSENMYRMSGAEVQTSDVPAFVKLRVQGGSADYRVLILTPTRITIQPNRDIPFLNSARVEVTGLVDAAGNPIKPASSTFTVIAAPRLPAPTGLTVIPQGNALNVSFNPVTDALAYLFVITEVQTGDITSFQSQTTTTRFVGKYDTLYSVQIASVDQNGEAGSLGSAVSVTTQQDPNNVGAPSNVLYNLDQNKILVTTFTPDQDAASTRLIIYRNAGGTVVIASVPNVSSGFAYSLASETGIVYLTLASVNSAGDIVAQSPLQALNLDVAAQTGNPNQNPFMNN